LPRIVVHRGGSETGRPGVSSVALEPALLTDQGQALRVTLFNSVPDIAVRLSGMQYVDGEPVQLEENYMPTADRLPNVFFTPLVSGSVKNIRIGVAAGVVVRGRLFAVVEITSGTLLVSPILQVVLSGYITTSAGISFPGSPIETPQQGAGYVHSVSQPSWGAGFPAFLTVPPNCRWWIKAASVMFTAAAGGAARFTEIALSGVTINIVPSDWLQLAAGTTYRIDCTQPGYQVAAVVVPGVGTVVKLNMCSNIVLTSGQVFTVNAAVLAADLFGALNALVEEWIDF
jgi:hypothetical protein